jgi:hypothetical protein
MMNSRTSGGDVEQTAIDDIGGFHRANPQLNCDREAICRAFLLVCVAGGWMVGKPGPQRG